jgi:hypothetical protein
VSLLEATLVGLMHVACGINSEGNRVKKGHKEQQKDLKPVMCLGYINIIS